MGPVPGGFTLFKWHIDVNKVHEKSKRMLYIVSTHVLCGSLMFVGKEKRKKKNGGGGSLVPHCLACKGFVQQTHCRV